MFCPQCGRQHNGTAVPCLDCSNASSRTSALSPPPPALTAEDLDQLRYYAGLLSPGPWRVGERYFEVLDAQGQVVLRVETVNSRQLAPALAAIRNALPALLPPKR